jgi:hypothetical protein
MAGPKEHPGWKRCSECLEAVPYKVKICPNCKSFQDWRRFVAVGQTNLALMVALTSVLTTLINVGIPVLEPSTSRMNIVYDFDTFSSLDLEREPKVTFYVRNDGKTGGILRIHTLFFGWKDFGLEHEPLYVGAGKEEKLVAALHETRGKVICDHMGSEGALPFLLEKLTKRLELNYFERLDFILDKVRCGIGYSETNYSETRRQDYQAYKCAGLNIVNQCIKLALNRYLSCRSVTGCTSE